MSLCPMARRAVLVVFLAALAAGRLSAQNVLMTELDGKYLPVRRARGSNAEVLVQDKLVTATTHRFALRKVDEYRPEFVSVQDLDVRTEYLNVEGSAINNEFYFHANLETPYNLEDVFIVLELDTDIAGKVLFLQEVGHLEPRESKSVSVRVPINGQLGEGKYQFHIMAGGLEVMHTNMPATFRDHLLDKMTFRRIAGVQDAVPQLFIGPPPEYPPALLKARTTGRVVISLRIGSNGRVYDPQVKSATNPALGDSALIAVRLWRFLPRVKGGKPLETRVDVPIDFTPPPDKKS